MDDPEILEIDLDPEILEIDLVTVAGSSCDRSDEELPVAGNKSRSKIWKHFLHKPDSSTKAKCLVCNSEIKCREGTKNKITTSGMRNHLQTKHLKVFQCLLSEEKCEVKTKTGIQRTIEQSLSSKKPWAINDARAQKVHQTITEMIALDNQPTSIVDDIGFQRLMNLLEPRYKTPSRKFITTNILPKLLEKCRNQILTELSDASHVSFTSNIWSSPNNESFISLTSHFFDKSFSFKHRVLNSKYFPGSHTGENIAEIILSMLAKWNISKEKVHLIVRDSGANMVKGVRDTGLNGIPCFLHTLQLCIGDAIGSQRAVVDTIAASRHIVGHFHHSSLACNRLKEIQTQLQTTHKKIVQDVPTRWNSTFYMLSGILEQKNAIAIYSTESNVTNLSQNQWKLVESVLSLLLPFEEVTKLISSSEALISEVIPFVATLKMYLQKDNDLHRGVGTMKLELKRSIKKRFSSIIENENYTVATAMDPRFKFKYFDTTTKEKTKANLIGLMKKFNTRSETPITSHPNMELGVSIIGTSTSKKTHLGFWDIFSELGTQNEPTPTSPSKTCIFTSELNLYISHTLIPRTENAYTWWKKFQCNFPNLSAVVVKFLSAPASSIYSERLFSEKGNVYEETRNRLLPKNGEALAFLHHNLRLLN